VAAAETPQDRLAAIRTAAKERAIPVRHGLENPEAVADALLCIADDNGLISDYGAAAVDDTISEGLTDFGTDPTPARGVIATRVIAFTPFVYRDPRTIPPRDWLYDRHYIRRYVTGTIGAPGMGKTSLGLVEAVAMTTGRPLLGAAVRKPLKVWHWNGEDPADETERRLAAILLRYDIDPKELEGRLFTDSGRTCSFRIASDTARGVAMNENLIAAVIAEVRSRQIDVLMIDPFVSSHSVGENDNIKIDYVLKEGFAKIADAANISVEVYLHTRKGDFGHQAKTVDDIRGASAQLGALRSARVINRMSQEEAQRLGVSEQVRSFLFRVDNGKANMQPPATEATWRFLHSQSLDNGTTDMPPDMVQVVEPWDRNGPTISLARVEAERAVDDLFLRLLDLWEVSGRSVRPTTSRTGAPTMFAEHPEALAAKVSSKALNLAMERLLASGDIKAVQDGKPADRKQKLVRAPAA
jgi:hypothetical protein